MVPTAAPVIDIAPYFTGDRGEKVAVAQRLGSACENTGFLLIVGHGISPDLTDQMVTVCNAFFDLSDAEKRRTCPTTENGPGYRPIATTALARTRGDVTPGDLNEGYLISPLLDYRALPEQYVASTEGAKWFRGNVWPETPAQFQDVWIAYYRAMEGLATTLMCLAALALDLPEGYFDSRIDRHTSQLSARRYPPVEFAELPNQHRAGAHTDYGAVTILWKDEGPASLEVQNKSGEWQPILPIPGSLIVNIGDLLAQWTNDRWVSTLHRVATPRDATRSIARLSLPFFFKPNFDAVIEPIASCVGNGRPQKYEPIVASEHLAMKRSKHVVA